MRRKSCRSCSSCSDALLAQAPKLRYRRLCLPDDGCRKPETGAGAFDGQEIQQQQASAVLADTVRPTIAGAGKHPGWNAARAIAERITTPLLPDDYLKLANPLWSARELRGRVLEVRRETVDSATLVIKPGWGFSFDYQPGQYIGIGLLVDGRWRWRSYSLTSSPVKGEPHHHHHGQGHARGLPVDPPGRRGGTRHDRAAGGAAGQLRDARSRAGVGAVHHRGSGITPVMSMLRTLVRRDQITDVVHLHSAPTESDVMFAAELAEIAAQPGRLSAAAAVDPHRRAGSIWRGWTTRCPIGASGRRGPAGPRACSTTPSGFGQAAGIAERLHLERFAVSKRRRARPGRHGGVRTQRQDGRRGRRHAVDGRRRGRRRPDAVRLPDGHLPVVCGRAARRARPRPAHRRRTRTRKPGTDMHFRSIRRLRTGRLGFTDW